MIRYVSKGGFGLSRAVFLLFAACIVGVLLFTSCYHGNPDYPSHDEVKYEYKIDLDGYELAKAYGSAVYEFNIPSEWTDKLNGLKPVKRIGSNSFASWKWLRDLSVPSSVVQIGEGAFEDLARLANVRYPNDCAIEKIEPYAFRYCTALKKIVIPSGIRTIEKQTYSYCEAATEVVFQKSEGESSLETICEAAFYGCSKLGQIIVPKGVKKIDRGAFASCSGLSSVGFEDGSSLEIIQDSAFARCSRLSSLVIPKSVRFIGREVLSGRGKNLRITYKGSEAEWNSIVKDSEWDAGSDNEITIAFEE